MTTTGIPLAADRMLTFRLDDEAATARLGARLASLARPGDAILLQGDYGAGKTTFARAFLRAATADATLTVPSPSYTLVQSYRLPSGTTAWHYDLWRTAGDDDLAELGWEEARLGIVLVEWPERLHDALPADRLTVSFAMVPGNPLARTVSVAGWPGRLDQLQP